MKISLLFGLFACLHALTSTSHAEAVFNRADGVMHVPSLRVGSEVYTDADFRVNAQGQMELLRYTAVRRATSEDAVIREIVPTILKMPVWYGKKYGPGMPWLRDPAEHVIRSAGDWNYFIENYPSEPEPFRSYRLDVDFDRFMLIAIATHPCDPGLVRMRSVQEYAGHIQVNYVSGIYDFNIGVCGGDRLNSNLWAVIPASAKPVKFVDVSAPGNRP